MQQGSWPLPLGGWLSAGRRSTPCQWLAWTLCLASCKRGWLRPSSSGVEQPYMLDPPNHWLQRRQASTVQELPGTAQGWTRVLVAEERE